MAPPPPFPNSNQPMPFPSLPDPEDAYDLRNDIPLGQRLLKAGLVTQSQLAQALREQQQNHLKLGEVCLEHRWITPEELYRFTASRDMSVGEILIALGHLEFDQLRIALAQQRRYGRKLGEILLWKGWVETDVLQQALQLQQYLLQINSANAWEALQACVANLAEVAPPAASPPPLDMDKIASGVLSEIQSDLSLPNVAEDDTASYQRKIEVLELQIQLQQQQWDAFTREVDQQVKHYQEQYQQRIDQLEDRIRQQVKELDLLQQSREGMRLLREDLRSAQSQLADEQQRHQQEIAPLRAQIAQLQSDLELARAALAEREAIAHQPQLDQMQREGSRALVAQLQHAQVPSLEPISDPIMEQLRADLASVQQALNGSEQRVATLEAELAARQKELEAARREIERSPEQRGGAVASSDQRVGEAASSDQFALTPWARNLFFQLQEAGLLSEETMEQVLATWQRSGNKLTQVLSEVTGLSPVTIKFFSDGGYTAKLSGARRIGDYLRAAGLVNEEQIQQCLRLRRPGQRLGEMLAERGLVPLATAEYFARTFLDRR